MIEALLPPTIVFAPLLAVVDLDEDYWVCREVNFENGKMPQQEWRGTNSYRAPPPHRE